MNFYRDVVLMRSSEIIDVVRRALSKIDPRLVNHGERVGFIASKIYEFAGDKSNINFSKLMILSVLHDIGAYKTNEIDDMVKFEMENSYDHALFGYVFLKDISGLSEYAEALLYHHTDYWKLEKTNCRLKEYAQIIYLADRMDILLQSSKFDLSEIKKMSGTKFNPDYVNALFKAEEKYSISNKIKSKEYIHEIEAIIRNLDISNSEIMDYLKLLVYAIDFRSPYTVTHTADTTIISIETGKLMGVNERDLKLIYIGAFLHDIGKIAIPYEILEKPDKLTAEEYEIIKRHIPEGEEILRGVVSDEICDIALRHHEKLDGSGYPFGLTGDKLTLSQRIVGVSDIFSALIGQRSYKKPFPKDKILKIFDDMKNTNKICPQVVDMVCNNYDLILKNAKANRDPVKSLYNNLLKEYKETHEKYEMLR